MPYELLWIYVELFLIYSCFRFVDKLVGEGMEDHNVVVEFRFSNPFASEILCGQARWLNTSSVHTKAPKKAQTNQS